MRRIVILGGVRRLGQVADKLVPGMCLLYVIGGLYVLFVNADQLPDVFRLIWQCAFAPSEAVGAFTGATSDPSVAATGRAGTFFEWFTNNRDPATGLADWASPIQHGTKDLNECYCWNDRSAPYNGTITYDVTPTDYYNLCTNNTQDFMVKVSLKNPNAPTCEQFRIKITNGR